MPRHAVSKEKNFEGKKKKREDSEFGPFTKISSVFPRMIRPPHIDASVVHCGTFKTSVITASENHAIFTNSLSLTASTVGDNTAWTSVAQSDYLGDLIKVYERFRVFKYHAKIEFVGRAAQSIYCAVIHSTNDPGYAAASPFQFKAVCNPHTSLVVAPPSTASMNVVSRVYTKSVSELLGSQQNLLDETYAGSISSNGTITNPGALTYLVLHVAPVSGIFTVDTTPEMIVTLTRSVRFYDPRQEI
jgi:hypothetical protein